MKRLLFCDQPNRKNADGRKAWCMLTGAAGRVNKKSPFLSEQGRVSIVVPPCFILYSYGSIQNLSRFYNGNQPERRFILQAHFHQCCQSELAAKCSALCAAAGQILYLSSYLWHIYSGYKIQYRKRRVVRQVFSLNILIDVKRQYFENIYTFQEN